MENKGFTLIEFLVIIFIIGLISSVSITSLNSIRERTRDAKRLANITQIQKALELYYQDNDHYPPVSAAASGSNEADCGLDNKWCILENELSSYIILPHYDNYGAYYYDSNLDDNYQTYGLSCNLEHSSNSHFLLDDNGYSTMQYEVGAQPSYCMNMAGYLNEDRDWIPFPAQDTVCQGGN